VLGYTESRALPGALDLLKIHTSLCGKTLRCGRRLDYRTGCFAMLRTSVAEHVLSALETVARTDEVRRNLDVDLFESDLLDSLGIVELIVLLSDRLGLELSPAEIDRDEWATPRQIVAFVERRVRP
jgi:D-alanine--poly(phosphoribitol) ligase subunit 2